MFRITPIKVHLFLFRHLNTLNKRYDEIFTKINKNIKEYEKISEILNNFSSKLDEIKSKQELQKEDKEFKYFLSGGCVNEFLVDGLCFVEFFAKVFVVVLVLFFGFVFLLVFESSRCCCSLNIDWINSLLKSIWKTERPTTSERWKSIGNTSIAWASTATAFWWSSMKIFWKAKRLTFKTPGKLSDNYN